MNKQSLDADLHALALAAPKWVQLPTQKKLDLLHSSLRNLDLEASKWVALSASKRGFHPDDDRAGEEWLSGPLALSNALHGYASTLTNLNRDSNDILPVTKAADGTCRVRLAPTSQVDRIIFQGATATAWMDQSREAESIAIGSSRSSPPGGRVALVLGAGNLNSIPPLDVLHKLYECGEVVILKLNPVNEYIGPILENILRDFIDLDFLRIVNGDAEVGEYLVRHEQIGSVHVTGSERTHDAIVFGTGEAGALRKKSGELRLKKPITSELGGVNPILVVPGPWSEADFRYQARHILTAKLYNVGFFCVSAQVVVLPDAWSGSAKLVDRLRLEMSKQPPRDAYYPGAADRAHAMLEAHPNAEIFRGDPPLSLLDRLPPGDSSAPMFSREVFGPVLGTTYLAGSSVSEYVATAIRFCNETVRGSLGITVLVHPATIRKERAAIESLLSNLEYGTVSVNIWNGATYPLTVCPWGAYPGHSLTDIQSGIGQVHNTWMLQGVKKTILQGQFAPFPRSVANGSPNCWPAYPWLIGGGRCRRPAEAATRFSISPTARNLGRLATSLIRRVDPRAQTRDSR